MNYITGYGMNNHCFVKRDGNIYSRLESLNKIKNLEYPYYLTLTDKRVEAQYAMMCGLKVKSVEGVLHNIQDISHASPTVMLGGACHTVDCTVSFPSAVYVFDDRIKYVHPDALGRASPELFAVNVSAVKNDNLLRQIYSGLACNSALNYIDGNPPMKDYMSIEGSIFSSRAIPVTKFFWTPEFDAYFLHRNLLWFKSVDLKKHYSVAPIKNFGQFAKCISDIQSNPSIALGNFKVSMVFGKIYNRMDWSNMKRVRFSYYACALLNYALLAGRNGNPELLNMMYNLFNYTYERNMK